MTIDEAIIHAREVANCCKSEISTFPNLEPYERYCNGELEKCGEEHEQLAKWLEELKELRETTFDYTKMLDARYEQGKIDGINKFVVNAITEFQKFDKEHGYPTLRDISVILSDVAEQLKEQKNE